MNYCVAAGDERLGDAWRLHPPTLPNGEDFPAADMIDTDKFRDVEVFLPLAATGRKIDLTFIYWQTFVATSRGADALRALCCSPIWFSPATTCEGDNLHILHSPLITGAIDDTRTTVTYHPQYPSRHPLSHMSGKVKRMSTICLRTDVVREYDLFYLSERPTYLFVSERLLKELQVAGIEGVGRAPLPQVSLS
jgi:hypothetical protein